MNVLVLEESRNRNRQMLISLVCSWYTQAHVHTCLHMYFSETSQPLVGRP